MTTATIEAAYVPLTEKDDCTGYYVAVHKYW